MMQDPVIVPGTSMMSQEERFNLSTNYLGMSTNHGGMDKSYFEQSLQPIFPIELSNQNNIGTIQWLILRIKLNNKRCQL